MLKKHTKNSIIPVLSNSFILGEKIIFLPLNNLIFCLTCLKKHINYQYVVLSCISGVDLLYSKYRFSVVYDLLSVTFNTRLRVKLCLNETTLLFSAIEVYKNANWWEREIWDFYGIYFKNHPDLRRILTDYGFEGYPMRKDYPIAGYFELRYDQNKKRVVVEPLELAQDFRSFTFSTNW